MGKRLVIEGLVQGVGYRACFADKSADLGLYGWVRNRRDG
jgi:acylphosphatase